MLAPHYYPAEIHNADHRLLLIEEIPIMLYGFKFNFNIGIICPYFTVNHVGRQLETQHRREQGFNTCFNQGYCIMAIGLKFDSEAPGQEESLGRSIPYYTKHAISVSLPTWRDNVGYEEGDKRVINAMCNGYPRFFIHKSIVKVSHNCTFPRQALTKVHIKACFVV